MLHKHCLGMCLVESAFCHGLINWQRSSVRIRYESPFGSATSCAECGTPALRPPPLLPPLNLFQVVPGPEPRSLIMVQANTGARAVVNTTVTATPVAAALMPRPPPVAGALAVDKPAPSVGVADSAAAVEVRGVGWVGGWVGGCNGRVGVCWGRHWG
jgi:hypothetical protein